MSRFWKWAAGDAAPILMLAAAILLLGSFAASVSDSYLTGRNWSGVFPLIATLALVAFGQQLLMLVGGIDLSVGPLMGFILSVESFFLVNGASPTTQAAGWALVLVVAVAAGLVNWMLVDPAGLHPMVATLITYMALQALSLMLRPVPDGMIADAVMDGIGVSIGIVPLSLLGAIAIGLALEFGLFRRRWGLAFRGFGSRPEAARVAGIRPRITLLLAYVGCSALTGLAAVLMIAQVGTGDPAAGQRYTLASIAAVVIGGASVFGGRGSFLGALLGALLITQVQVVTTFLGLRDEWQSYLLGVMILGAVALYSKSRQMAASA
jgi:ribose transport system ATP-binding protein